MAVTRYKCNKCGADMATAGNCTATGVNGSYSCDGWGVGVAETVLQPDPEPDPIPPPVEIPTTLLEEVEVAVTVTVLRLRTAGRITYRTQVLDGQNRDDQEVMMALANATKVLTRAGQHILDRLEVKAKRRGRRA